ncbi:MAG: hypothetical protein P8090_14265 [Gammaproteobacteria bacterium]
MNTAINTTAIAAIVVSAAAFVAVLLWSTRLRMSHGRSPRRELRRQLNRMPMGALLRRLGGDPGHYLHRTPAAEVHKRLQACAACPDVAHCKRLLASRCDASAFAFCPNVAALRAAGAEYERGWNPYRDAGSALPPSV